jgi:hypothetical protein
MTSNRQTRVPDLLNPVTRLRARFRQPSLLARRKVQSRLCVLYQAAPAREGPNYDAFKGRRSRDPTQLVCSISSLLFTLPHPPPEQ